MGIKDRFKIVGIWIIQRLLHVFCLFPINNKKILFCSFDGKQYADSPKYISEYYSDNEDITRVWALNKGVKGTITIPDDVYVIEKGTVLFYYHFFTSKEIVINDFISTTLRLRKNQVLLNTWHGGGSFKTVGFTSPNTTKYDDYFFREHAKNTSAYVLSSEFFGKAVINKSFHYYGTVLRTGSPRNSLLFSDYTDAIERVSRFYSIDDITKYTLVLYAPTFRSDKIKGKIENITYELDIGRCTESIQNRFGKPVKFIYRAHHAMTSDILDGIWLDGSSYPDMQDLVYCCNILISDYSSCMWDFAILKKPIIQFVPDLAEYTGDRNFLLPIEKWNFILVENNDEMEEAILKFNYVDYNDGIKDYLNRMVSYENVNATKLVCDWLDAQRKG